jgi:hypothetical protein
MKKLYIFDDINELAAILLDTVHRQITDDRK